jgi:hypothetical protein
MRIIITENQYGRLFEQEEIPCVPTAETQYYEVDVTIYDIMNNGAILHYGEEDMNEMGAIKRIQKKLGIKIDGYYGPTMLETLSTTLGIDLCKQKNNDIPIGPNGLTKLGLFDTTIPKDDTDEYINYILASTLVGECNRCGKDELFAIYSTIKRRSKGSMVDVVLKPKQYSTWNGYNGSDDKKEFLVTRISEQKRKGFDEMLSLVKEFRNKSPLKYNHYVNPTIVDLENDNRSIAKSYRDSKESAKQIGKHLFWWDKKHK